MKYKPLTIAQRAEITKISQQFASGFDWEIEGSGWLIVDPLSAYLCACGFDNKLSEMPKSDKHEQVLIMTFKDGSQFIPAGDDLKPLNEGFKNWMWL